MGSPYRKCHRGRRGKGVSQQIWVYSIPLFTANLLFNHCGMFSERPGLLKCGEDNKLGFGLGFT